MIDADAHEAAQPTGDDGCPTVRDQKKGPAGGERITWMPWTNLTDDWPGEVVL